MSITLTLAPQVGLKAACSALGASRATHYRWQSPQPEQRPQPTVKRRPALALSPQEEQRVLEQLNSERFADLSPAEVHATLLDEGVYLGSLRTFYRILKKQGQVRERRNQCRHLNYKKPELLATSPNQVWSWDITKLKGPVKWTYFYLYVLIDIFSRLVVGWMLADREDSALAKALIEQSWTRQALDPDHPLVLHSDRGASMTSKPVADLLARLGVTKSHSRPSVSNDNPFSEAHFKTLKYQPGFPHRFGSFEHGHDFCQDFFSWYNQEHHHSGIAMLTPQQVHDGLTHQILAQRAAVLEKAFQLNPARFKCKCPSPKMLPDAVWINPPDSNQNPVLIE
jgi:putative transposase